MSDSILKKIKDEDVKFVDLRFTDPKGKMQHVTFDVGMVDDDFFADGQMFDGSSISGWKAINESDMTLMPDTSTAIVDPFFQQTTLAVFCDILDPITGQRDDCLPLLGVAELGLGLVEQQVDPGRQHRSEPVAARCCIQVGQPR